MHLPDNPGKLLHCTSRHIQKDWNLARIPTTHEHTEHLDVRKRCTTCQIFSLPIAIARMNRIPFRKAHTYAIACDYANDYYYVFSCVQTIKIIRCDCANPNDFNVIIVVIADAMLSNVFHMASTQHSHVAHSIPPCTTLCENNHAIGLPIFINQIHKAHLLVKYSKFYSMCCGDGSSA